MRVFSKVIVCVVLGSAPFAVLSCAGGEAATVPRTAAGGSAGQSAAVPVAVATVQQKAMPIEVRAIGSVEPYSTVAVHAQLTGQLTAVRFKEGDDVIEGQPLFSLDRELHPSADDSFGAAVGGLRRTADAARLQDGNEPVCPLSASSCSSAS